MNEVLREIAIKAQVEHCISHVRLQAFAELIVKDCIEVCEKGTETQTTSSGVATILKQRYGV